MSNLIDPTKALDMIQKCFFDFYLCPECQGAPKQRTEQDNKINKEFKIEYNVCKCLKLRHYKPTSYFNLSYKQAMVFHVKDEIQWIAYYSSNDYREKIKFKVVEGADRFAVEQIILHKSELEYDHIPSFVFKPLEQMSQYIQTLITFQ